MSENKIIPALWAAVYFGGQVLKRKKRAPLLINKHGFAGRFLLTTDWPTDRPTDRQRKRNYGPVYTYMGIFENGHFTLSVFKNNIVYTCLFSEKCVFTLTRVYMPNPRGETGCHGNILRMRLGGRESVFFLSVFSVYMQTCKQSFPKSPLWPEFF